MDNERAEDDLKCQFCDKYFKSKITLYYHQKNTKFCLKKQGKTDTNTNYQCKYCLKILSTLTRLNSHIDICKVKIQEDELKKDLTTSKIRSQQEHIFKLDKENGNYKIKLKEKEEYISKLEDLLKEANKTISEIAKQPKTIQTNTNSNNDNRIKTQNNLSQVFDINDIKKINNVLEKHLTPDVLAKGQRGVAEMLKEHLLQNEQGELIYECTDVSRQKFEFINTYGFLEPDPKATKLLKSLSDANIFDVAHLTGKKLWEKENGIDYDAQHVHMPKVGEVLEINIDSSKLRSHLANITTK
jgi:hypothetical protein